MSVSVVQAAPPEEKYAAKIYERLTGVPLIKNTPKFRRMVKLIKAKNLRGAAKLATRDPKFYSLRLRNFAAPFSNKEESPQEEFNDLQAMIIGVTRDEVDARHLLTGDFRYQGYLDLGLPRVSLENNDHYIQFESLGLDPWRDLTKVEDQWPEISVAAGALTTRAWAKAHFDMGTNRRALEYSMQVFLCSPIEKWRFRGLPDDFIRRDVDRAPGGNPSTFQNHCRNCHAPMDGMASAFGQFDFVENRLVFMGERGIAKKMNQNGDIYPEGYITLDTSWVNYLTLTPSTYFGWRGKTSGMGVRELGEMLANSEAFSKCMVQKVFKEVCNRSLKDEGNVERFARDFESSGYKLKSLFEVVATDRECIPHVD